MTESTTTAIRMIGQLLLHHPTTGAFARDGYGDHCSPDEPTATCFCYLGACDAVERTLGFRYGELDEKCAKVLGKKFTRRYTVYAAAWDCATDSQRKAWATKLANYVESK